MHWARRTGKDNVFSMLLSLDFMRKKTLVRLELSHGNTDGWHSVMSLGHGRSVVAAELEKGHLEREMGA